MDVKNKLITWLIEGAVSGPGLRRKLVFWKINKEVNSMKLKGSWKTTLAGVATILGAVGAALKALTDNDPATGINLEATLMAITAGIGLITARDNGVSSEQVGAGNTGGK